ncbi:MAG TPA: aldo/keto reductase [Kofleriaceae bacterium]|nr:aldo/keto reductase [Kofleriaceae bacterium]
MSITTARIALATGAQLPQVGLGVYLSPEGAATRNAVTTALELGYRHIDTASIYGNEADVGAAIKASSVPRDQVFVTTKLWNDDHGYDAALRALDRSLRRLGLDYVDLYLIHWPVADDRRDSWRALERAFADGRARAIGVSNYLVPHLRELLGEAKVVPAVNQIELSPFLQRRDTCALCREHGIVLEAYSPLTRGKRLTHPAIVSIAREVGRSPAQILLRWGIQHGFVVLPKSIHRERIAENAQLFDFTLDAATMARLDGLEEGLATGWDPAGAP